MTIKVDIQRIFKQDDIPENKLIRKWVKKTLPDSQADLELTIRIVDTGEATRLNERWRKKKGPTNVLSFPFDDDQNLVPGLLGDIVLCAPVIKNEATAQNKSVEAHWAHMIIHGILHLLGYDHQKTPDRKKMESMETRLLESLGYQNPYNPDRHA